VLGRARYLKALTEAARRTDVRAVAERLQTAHSATVEWISTVLAEEALGGLAALRATLSSAQLAALPGPSRGRCAPRAKA
jgi:hypothetical protein